MGEEGYRTTAICIVPPICLMYRAKGLLNYLLIVVDFLRNCRILKVLANSFRRPEWCTGCSLFRLLGHPLALSKFLYLQQIISFCSSWMNWLPCPVFCHFLESCLRSYRLLHFLGQVNRTARIKELSPGLWTSGAFLLVPEKGTWGPWPSRRYFDKKCIVTDCFVF